MILHIISGLGMGGAERNLFQLAKALRGRGVPQHIVSLSDHDVWTDAFAGEGIDVTVLNLRRKAAAPLAFLKVLNLANTMRPRIIQGWMYHGDFCAAAVHRLAAGRKERSLFWNLRASDMTFGGYRGIIRLNAMLSAQPDAIIANSEAGLAFHVTRHGYKPRRTQIIPNGIDVDAFKPDAAARKAIRQELGLADADLVALHVARVDPMKDHASFLKAMARLPQVKGVMVGLGTESLQTPANVIGLGLRRDLPALYAAADVIVSSSVYGEGFSNILAEGMSCGLIPLATDVGDAKSILGECGVIVPMQDPAALGDVLTELSAMPFDERQQRGLQARARIVQLFSLDRAIEAYCRLYGIAS